MAVEIKPFNYANASKREYQAFNTCSNLLQAEKLPFDPPAPLADTTAQFQNVPDVVRLYFWLAWFDDANIIGFAFLALPLRENLRMAQFDIGVLPEYRNQDLGKRMLAEIVRTAKAEARDTLITNSNSNAAGGDAFLQHIGAEKGLETHAHQLHLAEIEKGTVSEWQQRSQERASGFELGWWLGPYPEEDLDAIVSLHQLLNQIPRGELDIEDFLIDARELRQEEKRLFTRGTER